MDGPPRKRQKTASPNDRASSPLRKPPRRPSFASPTKASLARNYPNLLAKKRTRKTTPRAERDDEELPATPSQVVTEEQSEPRRGILFSSPSKRPPRKKEPIQSSSLNPESPQAAEESSIAEGPAVKQKPDPELEWKEQEKERLLREVEELEEQISQCTKEAAKLQQQSPEHILQPTERDDLISLINEIGGGDDTEEPIPVANLLCSFLPFTARAIPAPLAKAGAEEHIPSHQPVELKDPLPYLQMFTSFQYTTSVSLPNRKSSNPLHQQHTIEIIGPQKVLTASISATIDTLSQKITQLRILSLPSYVDRELGAFMRAKAEENDLGNACWAIGSYWEVAKKRAEFWRRCEDAFGHLIPGRTDQDTENTPAVKAQGMTRRDLTRHMGRDVIVLQDKHVLLRICWRIWFDWSGEAESRVSVEPAVPKVCEYVVFGLRWS